ncbi:Gfo/Idh/MocA family protein [Streptomyces sp. PA5.6]|uniref:Gfo/Idh/MocA family protein n=1 Tax=Streptomyces sp. PA5.6 TaxID=3035651 RepID=UPI003904D1C0
MPQPMAETRPLRLGVLGCADIAWRRTLPALADVAGLTLTAVASRSAERARRFADRFGCAAVTGYQRLLDRDDVDVVYLPLPVALHGHWVERALSGGRHVLVEKPLAATAAEALRLSGLAASAGLVLRENFTFLHHPQHATVMDLISGGEIGELRAFTGAFGIPPLPGTDIRYRADLGGGALLDVGVYPLRAAQYFLGSTLDVLGSALHTAPTYDVDTSGDVLLRSGEGVCAHLSFGFRHGYRSAYEIWGSAGRIVVERAYAPPPRYRPRIRIEQQDRVERLTLPAADQFAETLRAFVAAVRGEPERGPAPGGRPVAREQLVHASLIDAIRASARGGARDSGAVRAPAPG